MIILFYLLIIRFQVYYLSFNFVKNSIEENLNFIKINKENSLQEMLLSLYQLNIQSVLVEGGAKTLQSFIDEGFWDEARVITNEKMVIENGIAAPEMRDFLFVTQEKYFNDRINYYQNNGTVNQ